MASGQGLGLAGRAGVIRAGSELLPPTRRCGSHRGPGEWRQGAGVCLPAYIYTVHKYIDQ